MRTNSASAAAGSADLEAAGLLLRLKAFGFDYLPIAAYILLLFGGTLGVIRLLDFLGRPLRWPQSPLVNDAIAFLTLVLPVALYFGLQESAARGATWGKRKAGLRVVDASGRVLSRKRALLRALAKLLPWQIAHTSLYHVPGWPAAPDISSPWVVFGFALAYLLAGAYLASALLSNRRRTLYDRLAGSYVIVSRPPAAGP